MQAASEKKQPRRRGGYWFIYGLPETKITIDASRFLFCLQLYSTADQQSLASEELFLMGRAAFVLYISCNDVCAHF
jgi:hypothetical protein